MLESFGCIRLPKLSTRVPDLNDLNADEQAEVNEQIVDIAGSDFLGSVHPEYPIDEQRIQGGAALQMDRGWGLDNILSVMQIPGLERQSSKIFLSQVIRVTTTHRQLIIKQLRPIDQLFKILESIQNQMHEELDLSDFEDFCERYTVVEVCSMLTQIISQGKDEPIQGSHKIDHSMVQIRIQKSKLRRQGNGRTLQTFSSRFNNQPRQSGHDNSPMRQNRSFLDDSFNDDLGEVTPFLYRQNEENKIANNCYFKQFDWSLAELAERLLCVYGDTVRSGDVVLLRKQVTSQRVEKEILTNKFEGILLYMQRILRPIWDLRLTRLPQYGILTGQLSNVAVMLTAKRKLENLRAFLETRQESLLAVARKDWLLNLRQEARYGARSRSE